MSGVSPSVHFVEDWAVPASQNETNHKRMGFSAIDPVRAPRSPPARWYEKAMVATSALESSFTGSEKHNELLRSMGIP